MSKGTIEDIFDAGWRAFVNELRKENKRRNERLYRVLTKISGEAFVECLRSLAKDVNEFDQIEIIRETPFGISFRDDRWKAFPEIWITQKSTADGMRGSVCVKIRDYRFIQINYLNT